MTLEAWLAVVAIWGFGGICFASIFGSDRKRNRSAEDVWAHAIIWPVSLIDLAIDSAIRRASERKDRQ